MLTVVVPPAPPAVPVVATVETPAPPAPPAPTVAVRVCTPSNMIVSHARPAPPPPAPPPFAVNVASHRPAPPPPPPPIAKIVASLYGPGGGWMRNSTTGLPGMIFSNRSIHIVSAAIGNPAIPEKLGIT
jgi:hypothetical protein